MNPDLKAIYWQLLSQRNIIKQAEFDGATYRVVVIGPAPHEYVPAIYYLKARR